MPRPDHKPRFVSCNIALEDSRLNDVVAGDEMIQREKGQIERDDPTVSVLTT